MMKATDVRLSKVCKWVGMLMLVGLVVMTSGCGSASKSIGVTPVTSGGGMVNASAEDIASLKVADKQLSAYKTNLDASSISGKSLSSKVVNGTVTVSFVNQTLQRYVAENGGANRVYLSHQYYAQRGFGNTDKGTNWYASENEYTWESGSYRSATSNGVPCEGCYFTRLSEKQANGSTLSMVEQLGRYNETLIFVAREYNGRFSTEKYMFTKGGLALSLLEGGSITLDMPTMQILSYGPFEISSNGKTYTIMLKDTLPLSMANLTQLTFKLLNAQSQEVGEASMMADFSFTFSVYQNGVLTPVSSL